MSRWQHTELVKKHGAWLMVFGLGAYLGEYYSIPLLYPNVIFFVGACAFTIVQLQEWRNGDELKEPEP